MTDTISDLWVIPPPLRSSWFAKIDWYLNWQLCKGLAHGTRRAPVEILRVTEEHGLPWYPPPVADPNPLMVLSKGRLPAIRCLVLEPGNSIKTWLTQVRFLAQQMNLHTLRVYLPTGTTITEANEVWRSFSSSDLNIEFTADEDASTWPKPSTTS